MPNSIAGRGGDATATSAVSPGWPNVRSRMPAALLTGSILSTYQPGSTSHLRGTRPSTRGAVLPSNGSSAMRTAGVDTQSVRGPQGAQTKGLALEASDFEHRRLVPGQRQDKRGDRLTTGFRNDRGLRRPSVAPAHEPSRRGVGQFQTSVGVR